MRIFPFVFIILDVVKLGLTFNRPPKITVQSIVREIIIRIGEPAKIPCVAEGFPKPTYRWERNGQDFYLGGSKDRVSLIPGVGTIFFNPTNESDMGTYQCFADNQFGVSVSNKVSLKEAKLEKLEQGMKMTHRVRKGSSMTLQCTPPQSFPHANIYWVLNTPYDRWIGVDFDKRITVDLEGRLHFSHVQKYDERDGMTYVCMAVNHFLRINTFGREHLVQVYGKTKHEPAVVQWTSPRDLVFLKGETLRIKCIFAGNPTPDIYWEKLDGGFPREAEIKDFGRELNINNVEESHAGRYRCVGSNPISPRIISESFLVRVESAPHWIEEPQDIEARINDKATFTCKAAGIPPPKYAWYINGNPLQINHFENNETVQIFRGGSIFSKPDENTITLRNVTVGDQMNIQCNASNIHGYVFADVYFNIVDDDQDDTTEDKNGGSVSVDEQKTSSEQTKELMDYQRAYYKGMVERQDLEREMLEVKVRVLKAVENKLNDLNVKKLLDIFIR